MIPNQTLNAHFFLIVICLLFCNINMTTHTAPKERTVPELVSKAACVSAIINYWVESEVANYTLLSATVGSACYTVLQPKNSRRSASAINPITKENTQVIPIYKHRETMHCTTTNRHLGLSAKWDTKEDKDKSMIRALYVLCMPNGMSRDEVT